MIAKELPRCYSAAANVATLIVAVKTADDEEGPNLIGIAPETYSKVAYFGVGWVGIALGGPDIDWDFVGDRIARSWELAAPRRLLEAGGR